MNNAHRAVANDKFYNIFSLLFVALAIFARVFMFFQADDLYWEDSFVPLVAGILIFPLAYIFAMREFGSGFCCMFLFLLVSNDSLLFYSVSYERWILDAFFVMLGLCGVSVLSQISAAFPQARNQRIVYILIAALIFAFFFLYLIPKLPVPIAENRWLNLDDSAGRRHGWVIFTLWFKDYFAQILGRHFINFHWFVFGILVWFNALLLVGLFVGGIAALMREKRHDNPALPVSNLGKLSGTPFYGQPQGKNLAFAVLFSTVLLLLLYMLKIYPLGMPFDEFLFFMRNWSQMQVVGSKFLVFIMPIVFTPAAFCIGKIFLKLRPRILIAILCVFTLLAVSANAIRIAKGTGMPEIAAVMAEMNKAFPSDCERSEADKNCPIIYLSKSTVSLYEIYRSHRDDGRKYFVIESMDEIKNAPLGNAIFLFAYNDINSIMLANQISDFLQKNYTGRIKGFSAKRCGGAVIYSAPQNYLEKL